MYWPEAVSRTLEPADVKHTPLRTDVHDSASVGRVSPAGSVCVRPPLSLSFAGGLSPDPTRLRLRLSFSACGLVDTGADPVLRPTLVGARTRQRWCFAPCLLSSSPHPRLSRPPEILPLSFMSHLMSYIS